MKNWEKWKLIWNVIEWIIDEKILEVLECLLEAQLSECNITGFGQRGVILPERACDCWQIFLLHHQRFDRKLIKIVHQQIADFSVFREINFLLQWLFHFNRHRCRRRDDSMFRAEVTNEMIFSTELWWAHFTMKPRRDSNALISHVSLQVSSSKVTFAASRTWKSFRVVGVHLREDFRHAC